MMKLRSLLVAVTLVFGSRAFADAPQTPDAIRQAFHQIIDRPTVDLQPELKALPDHDGLTETHLVFTSEPGQQVPVILLAQKQTDSTVRLPVVIVLHGTGGRKEDNLPLLTTLAKRGFLAISPDGRYHGERSAKGKGTDDYYAAIAQAYRDGRSHPWLYDTVYDVTRLIDYLATRPDVDMHRIGLMGFSKGGMETYITAAMDPRVAVAVPCISVQSFAYEMDNDQWHDRIGTVKGAFNTAAKEDGVATPDRAFLKKFYDRILPGIYDQFDCPNLLPLICPRPLLTINGEIDTLNPIAGTKIAIAAATKAYAAAGVPDQFRAEIEPQTAHKVNAPYVAEAVEWFVRWLAPK